ncbi:MAG: hypothetical protein N2255_05465 [Kiritimatiellae bacterium]|nr:hypothetical protein [Kiritimatiellia bacterium]
MSTFEAGMLICFGISWPVSIAKALRTRKVVGKSPLFMVIVCLGYASGLVHKVLYSFDVVTFLYGANLLMVAFDLFLYYRYLPLAREQT